MGTLEGHRFEAYHPFTYQQFFSFISLILLAFLSLSFLTVILEAHRYVFLELGAIYHFCLKKRVIVRYGK